MQQSPWNFLEPILCTCDMETVPSSSNQFHTEWLQQTPCKCCLKENQQRWKPHGGKHVQYVLQRSPAKRNIENNVRTIGLLFGNIWHGVSLRCGKNKLSNLGWGRDFFSILDQYQLFKKFISLYSYLKV